MGTGSALITSESIVSPIMFQASISKYFHRIGIDQPVQQVKMMRGFMDEQGASFITQSMPSPEVRSPMIYVQVPVEVY